MQKIQPRGENMYFDYHMHTNFSADCDYTMEEMCEAAIGKNLDEIAITDHHDIDYQDDSIQFNLDKEGYLKELEKCKEKFAGRLVIKKGIEMGLQPHILKESNDFLKDDFDFIICSFHTAEKKDLYNGDFFEGKSQWDAYHKYLESILEVVQNFDNYNVLGHLDLVRRYDYYDSKPDLMDNDKAVEIIREILKEVIRNDKGIEVNTAGYYIEEGNNPNPTVKVLELYKELGGRILTIGSDSHSPEQLAYKFPETFKMLKEVGFDKLTTFKNMKPRFHKI